MNIVRFLSKQSSYSRKSVLALLTSQRVRINGQITTDRTTEVSEFCQVAVADKMIVDPLPARYFMLNKPAGILSATIDKEHTTALELLTHIETKGLHIAGRLDRATTGLLIITDDGQWSRKLTELKSDTQKKIPKVYLVETAYPLSPETPARFLEGIYLSTEHTTTTPAPVEILSNTQCRLTIYEGRYHQVKRMFAAVGNRVVNLHREQIGDIHLERGLAVGEYRALTDKEINWIV